MSAPHDVYATARGPLARLASRVASGARRRRHERFFGLTGIATGHEIGGLGGAPSRAPRVLDVGCGRVGLRALEPHLEITGVDLAPVPDYPGPFVQADATVGLPFSDGEFDLAYCSSVIEHVPPERRAAFAAEVKRVARRWFVQTPARSFPIEPHSLLPGAHWLPPGLRRFYWRLGVTGGWEQIELLSRGEFEELFGAPALAERFGPFVKSWVCIGERSAVAADVRSAAVAANAPSAPEAADVVAEAVDDQEQQQHDPD
jgi:SAM-dependent methyltransferase